jgi:hypothetical protein
MIAYVGHFVTIKSNSKRYFGGYGKIRAFNPYSPKSFLIDRFEAAGSGLKMFWACRNEFEFVGPTINDYLVSVSNGDGP